MRKRRRESRQAGTGDEWVRTQQVANATPVRPAAKLSVEPADFPLLASIRGHDTHMRVTR